MGKYMDMLTEDGDGFTSHGGYSGDDQGSTNYSNDSPLPPEKSPSWYSELTEGDKKYGSPTPFSDPEKAADMSSIMGASVFNERQPRIDYMAKKRGISPDRYRVHEGRMAYQGDDGNWYYSVPEASADPRTWAQGLATGVGPSISTVVPAIVGGVTAPMHLAGPAGSAASMGLTSATGALAQLARETLAAKLGNQDVSPRRIGEAAAMEGLTQGIGLGITSFAQRSAAVKARQVAEAAKASSRLRMGPRWQGGERPVGDLAKDAKIPLTPAESLDLPALKAEQKMLSNLPETADKMGAFYRARTKNIDDAVDLVLDKIHKVKGSGLTGQETAGKEGVDAAQKAISSAKGRRSAAATPYYTEARASGNQVDTGDVLDTVDGLLGASKGKIRKDLESAKSLLYREEKFIDDAGVEQSRQVLDTSIDGLHNAKIAMDDMLSAPKIGDSALTNTGRRHIREIRNQLTNALRESHPSYEKGRSVFESMSPEVTRLENNIVGIVAGMPPGQYRNVTKKLFEGAGPLDIRRARRDLKKVAPETWKKLKRAYLEDQWSRAGKETLEGEVLNRGAKFRKLLVGDLATRRNMRAMLEPEEYRALLDLGDVLEAAGRVKTIGSDTTWNKEMVRVARIKNTPLWAKVTGNFLTPQKWGEFVTEWATERNMRKNMNRYAEAITSPDSVKLLMALKKLTPGSARWRVGLVHLLTKGTSAAVTGTGLDSDD